jgi:hypothetical protein
MLTKIMKWVSIAALLLAALWRSSASYQVLLQVVVCVTALLVVTQAIRTRKYLWVPGFVAIAVLFNPVVPVSLSRKTLLWLDWVCLMTFLISLAALRWQPRLTIPSITSELRRSKSL